MKGSTSTLLCKLKHFLCFNPSFHYGWQKIRSRKDCSVKFGKCCSWLISCEIVMSSVMKPTEKFVPSYMLVKNKKLFQRAVLVFP